MAAHRLVTVCSGALLAARAGLLGGRRCTTHHELIGALRVLARDAQVVANRVFVFLEILSFLHPRCDFATSRYGRAFARNHSSDLHEREQDGGDGGDLRRTQSHKVDN